MDNKIEIYKSVGRMPDISKFECSDIYINNEYIGTYQPEIWHRADGTKIKLRNRVENRLRSMQIFTREIEKLKEILKKIKKIAEKRDVGCGEHCEINIKYHNCNAECNAYYLKTILDEIEGVLEDV